MTGIMIVTHGQFGKELLRSAEMVIGEYPKVCSVSFEPGDSLDSLKEEVEKQVLSPEMGTHKLILVDFFSGSPFNASIPQLQRPEVEVVTGVNLPMLVEVLMNKEQMTAAELKDLAISTKEQIRSIREIMQDVMDE